MTDVGRILRDELLSIGADIVGFGDLTVLPPHVRKNMPVGVCVAVKYPKDVIRGISELPTREYKDNYDALNRKLDTLVTMGADTLAKHGYAAFAMTIMAVGWSGGELSTRLPHKTVATLSRVGWIGKSALLITEEYGSMVRISTILTNAPLDCAEPYGITKCAECMICASACPAGAIKGANWRPGIAREEIFDAEACRKAAQERSMKGFGERSTICGKCIEVCPYTRRYLDSDGE